MSRKTDFHVDISKYLGGEFLFSTWGRKNSSEEWNETSEEMNDAYVENFYSSRGDLRISTWLSSSWKKYTVGKVLLRWYTGYFC